MPAILGYATSEAGAAAERGEVVLLGCLATGNDPTHVCPGCRAELVRTGGHSYRVVVRDLACATCGRTLGGDPEDEPDGDAGLVICGECNQARNFDVLFLGDDER